jgi:hypothetical protein
MSEPPDSEPAITVWDRSDVWGKMFLLLTRSPVAQQLLTSPPADPQAASERWSAFLQELRDRLFGYATAALRWPGRSVSADDLTQEAFARIWEKQLAPLFKSTTPPDPPPRLPTLDEQPLPEPFDDPRGFSAGDLARYSYGIVRNVLSELIRKEHPPISPLPENEEVPVAEPPPPTDSDDQRAEFQATLRDLVARAGENGESLSLSPEDQQLLWLRYAGTSDTNDAGTSDTKEAGTADIKELARQLGISYSAAAQRLSRLLKRIRKAVTPKEQPQDNSR